MERRLAAILVSDVVGYSNMMEADEAGTLERLKTMRSDIFDPIIREYGGRIFKNTGDGALVEFGSVVEAVRGAIQIQHKLSLNRLRVLNSQQIILRIGINLGDIIVDSDDLFGNGVNVAARMEALAQPGEICISESVYSQVVNSVKCQFEDLGNQSVKGMDKKIRCYRLSYEKPEDGLNSENGNILAPPDKPSIAVLPFQNMSGDPEQEFFADGMAEDIITGLSRYRSLFVIARNSSFSYKGQSPDLRDVSRDLGVRYVLEGSVRKSGSRIRITGQLIEGDTGRHIWAERYDRDLTDLFSVQDEITEAIVAAIGPEIDQVERDRAKRLPPENLDAWECYQKGLWNLYRFNKDDNTEAQSLFKESSRKSINFAPAKSALTHALYFSYMHGYAENRVHALGEAFESGRQAVAFDGRDPDAHFALGRILYLKRDLKSSISQFQVAINYNPSFAHAHFGLGSALLFSGEWVDAIENIDRATRLSPHDPLLWIMLTVKAMALYGLKQYQDAEAVARQASSQPTSEFTAFIILVAALSVQGKEIEGKSALADLMGLKPDLTTEHLKEILPFKDQSFVDHFVESLRKIGFVEASQNTR